MSILDGAELHIKPLDNGAVSEDTAPQIPVERDLRPSYYDDFHCLAEGCRLSCCKGWSITFDKKDYLSLKREKGSAELNARLESGVRRIKKGPLTGVHYGEFVMDHIACPLLREDGLCMLQAENGHGALPFVCRSFPRMESYQPSGYFERSLTPACEGVLALLWELPEGLEFRSDPLPREKYRTVTSREWLAASFQDIRGQCIDFLQDRRFTLPQRILLMGLALKELTEGEADVDRWLAKARALPELPGITGYLQEAEPGQALPLFLSNCIRVLLGMPGIGDFQGLQGDLLQGLGVQVQEGTTLATVPTAPYLAARERYQERFAGREYFMENLMVSLFFELKMPTLTSAEDLWKSYVNFCNLYSIYRFMAVMSCREGAAGDRDELFRLLVYASRSLIHDRASQTALRDNFFQNGSATLAHMSVLLSG